MLPVRTLLHCLRAACVVLQAKIIPESILQMCIKVSNEPPSDMKSNMRRAFAAFTPEAEERLSTTVKRTAYKSVLFGLCFYHSLLLGRKKFGTGIGTGMNMHHPSPPQPVAPHTTHALLVVPSWSYEHFQMQCAGMLVVDEVTTAPSCDWHAGSGSGMGFCRGYSFNTGDLTTCGDVLLNYLEAYESVPWDDLRYMFGEVRIPALPVGQAAKTCWASKTCWAQRHRHLHDMQAFGGGHLHAGSCNQCL